MSQRVKQRTVNRSKPHQARVKAGRKRRVRTRARGLHPASTRRRRRRERRRTR